MNLNGPFIFRLNENSNGQNLLIQVCIERGWKEYTGDNNNNNNAKDRWNLWWKSGGFTISHHKTLLPWQFINRIPKARSICEKDNLMRHLKCMRQVYGSIYDISPSGYNLPLEYTKLAADCSRLEKDDRIWICKPVGQSQGRGIFLFQKLSDLKYDSTSVVQKYIEKPLLISGYKFDLRLYVCIPSYRPLVIYLYNEGLARFATQKFSLENLNDPFRHLTNSALNKLSPGYSQKKERIGAGSKWNFKQLRRYLEQSSIQDWFLWQRIACLVTLTILSQTGDIPETSNCFEFFGFDVLIDTNLKPWLLEVNNSPALGNDCQVDSEVKKPLLHDLFDLLGLPVCNTLKILSNTDIDNNYYTFKYYQSRCSKKHCKINKKNTMTIASYCQCLSNIKNMSTHKDNYHNGNMVMRDNGRNWYNPRPKEGGWIRIYKSGENIDANHSIYSNDPRTIEKEIKNSVLFIQKYIKVAKNVEKEHGNLGDERCNEYLRRKLNLNCEIWLPDK